MAAAAFFLLKFKEVQLVRMGDVGERFGGFVTGAVTVRGAPQNICWILPSFFYMKICPPGWLVLP
jgi:hypothetical protein